MNGCSVPLDTEISKAKTIVLLVNLGTPDAPTAKGVKKFLKEFLSDPRVVEMPRLLWWCLLRGVVLPFRCFRTAKQYQTIWTDTGSPMRVLTAQLSKQLSLYLSEMKRYPIPVVSAMTYGNPSLAKQILSLSNSASRLIVLPLFPYYSGTTTASVLDIVTKVLSKQRCVPSLFFIHEYGLEASHIEAVAASITEYWDMHGKSERLLFSFHGIPKRNASLGDSYPETCRKASEYIAKTLNIPRNSWETGFQSRFGFNAWVEPYTDELLIQWAREGIKSVDIVSPCFAVDCLETLEELCYRMRVHFLKAGGETLNYIPALNHTTRHVSVLGNLIAQYL